MTTSSVNSTSNAASSGLTISTAQGSAAVDDPASTGLTESDYVTAKLQPYIDQADTISTSISDNETKITAYQDMQAKLQALATAAQALAGVDGQDATADVFAERAASLTSNSSTDASDILSASVAAGTATGTHTVTVTQLAQAEQISSGDQSSESSALGLSDTFTIGAGSDSSSVSVTSDMSLSDIAQAINNTTSTSGVKASIVEVSDSQYVIEITAVSDNAAISMSDSGTVLYSLGLTGSDGSTAANVIQQAQPAELTVDGISGITRDSNTISDVISGVTLNLTAAAPDTTVTVDVTPDTDAVTNAVDSFVSAYNDWQSFVAQNQATNSDGTASSSATLFGDSTLRAADIDIQNALSSLVDDTSLGDVGISLNSSNQLTVNSTDLASALADDFTSVQGLFEYQASTSSSNLSLVGDNESTYTGTFTLNFTTDSSGDVTGVTGTDSSTGQAVDFTISGDQIIGASGSPYAGLTFTYSGGTTTTPITVTVSQGIGDHVYQTAENYGNSTDGTVQTQIGSLTDSDTQLQQQLSSVTSEADSYYNFLLNQYGLIESQIAQANQTSSLLQELLSYQTSSG